MQHFARLTRWDFWGLGALVIGTVAFGVFVEIRSAYLSVRRTDLNVYVRAAWAVRAGEDPYEFITLGECNYNYPPLLSILMIPLADNLDDQFGLFTVPFSVSVAIWFLLSVLAAIWGVLSLARAVEERSLDPRVQQLPVNSRRWWLLRLTPILICLPGIARTLSLGQVDLFVLGILCGSIAAAVRRHSLRAGLWMGLAICIKFIPVFLLVYPLWRRDGRWLAGSFLGLVVGWGLIPSAYLGPTLSWQLHRRWVEVVILPGAGVGQDTTRQESLTSMRTVNSQSLVAIVHNFQYPDRLTQPDRPDKLTSILCLAFCAVLTVLTLLAIPRKGELSGPQTVLALGTLINVMLLTAPVCHPHYLCHWLPLTLGLIAWDLERRRDWGVSLSLIIILPLSTLANSVTSVPGLELLRESGLATAAGLLLWGMGIYALMRIRSDEDAAKEPTVPCRCPSA